MATSESAAAKNGKPSSKTLEKGGFFELWLADNPEKRWTEHCFLVLAVGWITMFAFIISTAAYERFAHVEYMARPCSNHCTSRRH